jgi:multiple sugar transport system substrate-binding protein
MALMLLSAVYFTACGINKQDVKEETEETWKGVITLWDFPRWPDKNGNRFGWIEKKIAEFERSHPGVFIHLRKLKWEYGMIELRAATSTGTYPDMAPVASDFDFIAGGYLEPLDEFFSESELSRYDPKALEAVTYQGRIYGYPWFMTTHGLFLNLDSFKARGAAIPEEGRWTYDEFVQALQKLTYETKRDKKVYYGFNLYLSPGSYQIWGFLTMDGAKIFDEDGNFALNSLEGVSALSKMVDLAAKYRVVPEEEYGAIDENAVWGDFAEKRKIAVYPAGSWAVKILADRQKAEKGFEFEVAHYPKGQKEPLNFALVSGYAIFKRGDNTKKAVCAEFLRFITSEKEQEALADYGVFPARIEAQQKVVSDPYMKRMKEILDASQVTPKIENWHKVDEAVTAQVRQALLRKKTPSQALEDAAREVEKILAGNKKSVRPNVSN